jgi:N-acetylglutamate synthase-like GNAT family acetyltransferase
VIRKANKFDIPVLLDFMREYAKEAPVKILNNLQHHNDDYVASLLTSIIMGRGFIFVDDELNGMIVAIITPNLWCPTVLELHELAWWIKPEKRNWILGGRLWRAFEVEANKMLKENRVQLVTVTKMSTSPSLDYEKRGFQLLDMNYFKE